MSTTTLRSTLSITSFVELSDELAALKLRQKQVEQDLKRLQPEVLDQIGERREVRVNKQVRILTPRIEESISRSCDDETIVEWCKSHGLKYSERSAEYVAPATFVKYVRENLLPENFIERTTTTTVNVM